MAEGSGLFGGRKRRENAPGGRRHAHKVLVTPEEEAALLARANRLGVTIPRLLVEAALSEPGASLEERSADVEFRRQVLTELFAVQRALGASANNINQLAKVANATGEMDESLPHAVAHLRKVSERVSEAMEQWAVRS